MSDFSRTLAEAKEEAERRDCDVIVATSSTLLLDFDSLEGVATYERNRDMVNRMFQIKNEETWRSGSGLPYHLHVVLTLDAVLNVAERVALQAALGSDPVREMLSIRRIHLGDKNEPSLLFKPKAAAIPSDDEPF